MASLRAGAALRTVVLGPVEQQDAGWMFRVSADCDAEPCGMQVVRVRADDPDAAKRLRQDLAVGLLVGEAQASVHDVDHPLVEQRMCAAAWPGARAVG